VDFGVSYPAVSSLNLVETWYQYVFVWSSAYKPVYGYSMFVCVWSVAGRVGRSQKQSGVDGNFVETG